MKLTRKKRIALELLGPPALGAILMTLLERGKVLFDEFNKGNFSLSVKQVSEYGAFVLIFAYIFSGLQSIIYTAVMEWKFTKGLNPTSWKVVRLSSALGFGSGAVLAAVETTDLTNRGIILLTMGGLGLIVGFLMGLLIKRWSTEKKTIGENQP